MKDIDIRFEAVKIASNRSQVAQGVTDILYDAEILYCYIKTGEMPTLDTAN